MLNRFIYYKNTDYFPLVELDERFYYFYFTPSFFNRKKHKGLYRHSGILYLFWYFFTLGKYKIFYIVDKETKEIVHFSNIMPKIFKYKFMSTTDLQILHCYTYKKYRGMGFYTIALSNIQQYFSKRVFWIGSHVNNIKSINVIEKSGFKRECHVSKKTIFGIYKRTCLDKLPDRLPSEIIPGMK